MAVLTQHNDNYRTGMNLQETILNVNNVNQNAFGSVGTLPIDDVIYAQPLVMTNVAVPGAGKHNLVYVVTASDSVYAYDADNVQSPNLYWKVSFLSSNAASNVMPPQVADIDAACHCVYVAFTKNFGIVGTPVIDPSSGTLYVVAMTKEITGTTTNFVQRLHALNVATGAEQPNSPVVIAASCPGTSIEAVGGVIQFSAFKQVQRPGLLLVNGMLYIAWASFDDFGPYHGWVLSYSTADLTVPPLVFNTSTASTGFSNGGQGGIWMSGTGLAADADGNVYAVTGNGVFDGAVNFSECTLKLTPGTTTLNVASYFAPYNWAALNQTDQDLATGGMLLIPNTSLMVCMSKLGQIYVVNRDNMGGVSQGNADTNIVQTWNISLGTSNSFIPHGGPAWWNGPGGPYMYLWPSQKGPSQPYLQQYEFDTTSGQFDTNPVALNNFFANDGSAGGVLSVSANGTNANTGIVWAIATGKITGTSGTLHAFNAENISEDLWDTTNKDSISKWVPPTVANGKVYVPTTNLFVRVYGLFPLPPLAGTLANTNMQLSWPVTNFPGFSLQGATNIGNDSWLNLTNTVTKSNGANVASVPVGSTNMFFRLKR
ncbi:MAG TPA: hypothetical protein VGO59_13410 [Verrucomicrobiae bacterium]